MFPDSVAAVLGFLFVVAPGLLFEQIRERRRPATARSGFREISSVALASLALSLVALLLVAGARALWPGLFPDFALWLKTGHAYVADNFAEVLTFLLTWAILATLGGFIGPLLFFRRGTAAIDPHTVAWFEVFRKRTPEGTVPMALVRLDDGTGYLGQVLYYDANVIAEERELVLGPPLRHRTGPTTGFVPLPPQQWEHVVLPASRIVSLWVRYPPREAFD